MEVVFVSGSRADWRLVEPMLRTAEQTAGLRPQLILTGSHLSARHGHTADHVRAAGFEPLAEIPVLEAHDTPANVTAATGKVVSEIGRVLAKRRVDWLVVVGDRYESFAAGVAATMLGIPLAHVAGGETDVATNQDGNLRNALTKLAQLHCVANATARERLLALGEEAWRIFETGLPSLDQLTSEARPRRLLEEAKLVARDEPFALVSFLPVTLEAKAADRHLDALLSALERTSLRKLWVLSNADAGGDRLDARIRIWGEQRSDVVLTPALSPELYATALKHADLYIGNSSSGVIETPIFGTPSVIVGRRQQGRELAANVSVVVDPDAGQLARAIKDASQRQRVSEPSPFGDGHAAPRICAALEDLRGCEDLLAKRLVPRAHANEHNAASAVTNEPELSLSSPRGGL